MTTGAIFRNLSTDAFNSRIGVKARSSGVSNRANAHNLGEFNASPRLKRKSIQL